MESSGAPREVERAHRSGRQLFCGLELLAAPGALVPRPETELLARCAVDALAERPGWELRVVDMCCGSGNLACVIASQERRAQVWASDLTDPCVELARRNAAQLDLLERLHVVQGDLFAALHGLELEGTIDAVVCNPPYISTGKLAGERAELLEREPREAFDGGPYGLSVHQRVIAQAVEYLKPGGLLLIEFGLGQERQVAKLVERAAAYTGFRTAADDADRPRVALAAKLG
jgi:release factor glutamine methyltransferase